MKFRFLVDNKTENPRCMAEWGLSILIESRGKKILMDTGASPLFAENAKAMGVDLSEVDALVISHGHYDHTEGAPAFIELNEKAPIYLHEKALGLTFGETGGIIDEEDCGIRWSREFLEQMDFRLALTQGMQAITDNITLIGNIPDFDGYPSTERFWRAVTDDNGERRYVQDRMEHEQFLVVEEEKGLYIFSGCSHRGVVPTIKYTQQLFPGKRIAGLIAGMHLYPVSPAKRAEIVEEIARLDMDCVFPVHCTGMEAILKFKMLLKDKCIVASAGDVYEY
ncbi:MAG: MBL fold metallo-hydrolase [Firmicutes bacterium]|nr:MBL fold metallo-hydrolase [Bacillota bacterium]